eukprot:TRINITY_DN742_c0_g2_i5.p1 TRINITY_DN742_c0_g2~~TRINITY_DN742_c0_g2_i5.p1  ORF type:complete len:446 (+),score=84.30 TRINITY_DN742_c0_g2_i5:294-1631(+)
MLQALFGVVRGVKFTEFKSSDNCDKEGPLYKRGSAPLHRWKEKWFVLQNETLFEFANQKSRSVYSKFVLQDAIIEPVEWKKKEFTFLIKLHPSNNVLTLAAPSESEMIDWMNLLFKASCFKLSVKSDVPPVPKKPLPAAPSERNMEEAERLKRQLMIKRVTMIQALWRGRQCRKVYPQIVRLNKQRLKIVNELLETERTYLSYLAIIIELYQKPMEEKASRPKPLISTEDVNKIFSDIEIIYSIHRMLRRELEERIQNWFPQQKLAPVFNMLCSSMKSYAQYVNNYDTAIKVLESHKSKSAFAAYLETLSQNTGLTMDLFALLIMPVQRPPRLCMLLRDLLNKTWKGHEDENDLREAVGQMEAVTAYLNESKREAENRSKVFAIQQHLQETGRDTILELLQPHRRYICEGSLIQISENGHKKKERYGTRNMLIQPLTPFLLVISI